MSWLQHQQRPPLFPLTRAYLPHLTAVKTLLAQDTSDSLREAAELLSQLRAYHETIHHKRFSIEILSVQALLEEAQGDRSLARSTLTQALRLAEPGGFIRLFVDLGPGLKSLLHECAQQEPQLRAYAEQLLKALESEYPASSGLSSSQHGLIEELSRREREILDLLAQRYRNREIAERLFISPRTVKKHLYNLYQKLGVHGRREAVAKAVELKIISSPG